MFNLIIELIIIGLVMWLVNNYIPMDAKIKKILNIVVFVCVILWLLQVFGVFSLLHSGPVVPKIHK